MVTSLFLFLLPGLSLGAGEPPPGVEIKDAIDVKASRAIMFFMKACVLGGSSREERIGTLDAHPWLKRMPLPPESAAAKAGRMVWGSPPDTFFVLERDGKCMEIVSDERIKDRLDKLMEAATLGRSNESDSTARFKRETMDETVIKDYRAKNVDIRTYLWRKPASNVGLWIGIETSVIPSRNTDAVRIWVRKITFNN